jgi:sugar phosphate isomerase/epimerase
MRLGAPVFGVVDDPDRWIAIVHASGYSAAYFPLPDADEVTARAYAQAANEASIVIAEVHAFGFNPISPDDAIRRAALERCKARLALAELVGARCAVNVAGSRQLTHWRDPHQENLTPATFDLIVETVREIIDAVKPSRTYYTLETMPWIYPDSADSYLALITAIDRPQFAVHFDPVNLICSPQRYYRNADLIREFVAKLGPHIRSCHGKDTVLGDELTTHLSVVQPGMGGLDYRVLLRELDRLDPDTPLMLERLSGADQYSMAADYVRSVATDCGVQLR